MQTVIRPNHDAFHDFRGLAGRVAGEPRSDKRVRNPRLYAQFTYFF